MRACHDERVPQVQLQVGWSQGEHREGKRLMKLISKWNASNSVAWADCQIYQHIAIKLTR